MTVLDNGTLITAYLGWRRVPASYPRPMMKAQGPVGGRGRGPRSAALEAVVDLTVVSGWQLRLSSCGSGKQAATCKIVSSGGRGSIDGRGGNSSSTKTVR